MTASNFHFRRTKKLNLALKHDPFLYQI